jgi:hypothetical protein
MQMTHDSLQTSVKNERICEFPAYLFKLEMEPGATPEHVNWLNESKFYSRYPQVSLRNIVSKSDDLR